MKETTNSSDISGRKQEQQSFEKHVGFFQAKVLKINPTKEELNEILGTDKITDDIEYTGEKDGIETVKVNVWVEDVKSKKKFQVGFYIMDKEVFSEKTGKYEFMNSVGSSAWAKEEEDLPEYFTNFTKKDSSETMGPKAIRKALVGEDKLYKFLRSWIELDYFHPDTKLFVNKAKLMKGDLSDLNNLLTTDIVGQVILMATVRTKDDEGEVKEYQNIYNNAFLPGSYIKHLRINSDNKPTMVKNFIKDVTDSEYGCKDFYFMGDLKVYDKTDNLAAGNAIIADDDANY